VKVEPSSVNAIALDEEAADQHDRLMVGGGLPSLSGSFYLI